MGRYGVGLGMLGEQGGESIHAEFNTLAREFKHTVEDLNGLRMIVKQHRISTQRRCHQSSRKFQKFNSGSAASDLFKILPVLNK